MLLKHIFTFILVSGSAVVFGSSAPKKEVVVKIATGSYIPRELFILSNVKNRKICEGLGFESKPTDPFIPFQFLIDEVNGVRIPDEIKDLHALPVACFTSGNCFKKTSEDILSFPGKCVLFCLSPAEEVCFKLRNQDQRWLTILKSKPFFDQFTGKPNYRLDDIEELEREGLIERVEGGKYKWPEKTTFISSLKKPFFWLVGSLGLVLIVVLCKKHFNYMG